MQRQLEILGAIQSTLVLKTVLGQICSSNKRLERSWMNQTIENSCKVRLYYKNSEMSSKSLLTTLLSRVTKCLTKSTFGVKNGVETENYEITAKRLENSSFVVCIYHRLDHQNFGKWSPLLLFQFLGSQFLQLPQAATAAPSWTSS